jgi:heme/copper-type cytochrome/quinol oxidase subunit 1
VLSVHLVPWVRVLLVLWVLVLPVLVLRVLGLLLEVAFRIGFEAREAGGVAEVVRLAAIDV